jgi:hypothetical protein
MARFGLAVMLDGVIHDLPFGLERCGLLSV